jgi:transposase
MDQVYVIRHKVLVESQSVRRVARELGVSRNTVRRYVEGATPCVRTPVPRAQPVKERVRPRVEQLLADAPRWTGGKQRLTAARLHQMLVDEGHAVGERTVREMVAEWKRRRQEVFVPLVYKPGDLGEVDFFEVLVDVGGERRKAWMFVMRLMCSGRDFAWLYPRQDQVCFLDGHVRAFAHFGVVPHRLLSRYLRRLERVDLMLLDEAGFVPFDRTGGELLFNVLAARHGRRSVLITTNLAFAEWPRVFGGDEKLTTALLDRLAEHATVFTTKGKSYRMRRRAPTTAQAPAQAAPNPAPAARTKESNKG